MAHRDSSALAERLILENWERQGVGPEQLTVHADRGSSMTSKPVALLLPDLGVTERHLRLHVSHDTPSSECAVQDDEVPGSAAHRVDAIMRNIQGAARILVWSGSVGACPCQVQKRHVTLHRRGLNMSHLLIPTASVLYLALVGCGGKATANNCTATGGTVVTQQCCRPIRFSLYLPHRHGGWTRTIALR